MAILKEGNKCFVTAKSAENAKFFKVKNTTV
jgi:hypothetical protein